MKNWIRAIFAINGKLDALADSIDVQVESLASLITVPAMELFDDIIKLNDKKVRLINLRVLHDKMRESLTSREYFIVKCSSSGESFSEIAQELGIGKNHVYRAYVKILHKLIRLLNSYGYDAQKFENEYKDLAILERTYKKFARKKEAS